MRQKTVFRKSLESASMQNMSSVVDMLNYFHVLVVLRFSVYPINSISILPKISRIREKTSGQI